MNTYTYAVSYKRFSSKRQEQGDSLRRQTDAYQRFCQQHGLEPIADYRDLGKSAWSGKKREGLERFLDAIPSLPKGTVLVIEALDRLSRLKLTEGLALFSRIIEAGIPIGSCQTGKIYTEEDLDGFGIVEPVMALILSRQESNRKSKMVKKSYAERLREGGSLGNKPSWIDKANQFNDRAEIVRDIISQAMSGKGSYTIAKELNAQNIPPLRGKAWQSWNVTKLLRQRTLYGCLEPKGKQPMPGYYPALITEDQWYALQAAIDNRKHNQTGRQGKEGVANLFTGILTDHHGYALHLQKKRNGKMLVSTGNRAGLTDTALFPYKALEDALLLLVKEIGTIDLMPVKTETNALQNELDAIEGKINEVQSRLTDNPNIGTLLDALTELDAKRARLTADLEQVKRENTATDWRNEWITEGKQPDRYRLRASLQRLIKSITLTPTKLDKYTYQAEVRIEFRNGLTKKMTITADKKGVKHFRYEGREVFNLYYRARADAKPVNSKGRKRHQSKR